MSKQIVLISQILILVTISACGAVSENATPPQSSQPTTIQDPSLIEAWNILNDNQENALDWDNHMITGHELAKYILERSIPVQFDTEGICQGSSCSVRYCAGDVCDFEDGNPGIDPIYISLKLKDDPERLVRALMHEIYHRMEPFGNVRDTLFEEFWAYAVEAQLSGSGGEIFLGCDPKNSEELVQWFEVYQAGSYAGFEIYPEEK